MGVSGQRHAPAALYPRGKDPRYPLYRRLGGPQSRSGHRRYRKNPLPLPGIEPRSPGRPARSQTLYCLSYPALDSCTSKGLNLAVSVIRNTLKCRHKDGNLYLGSGCSVHPEVHSCVLEQLRDTLYLNFCAVCNTVAITFVCKKDLRTHIS
jgi:hypothetical protein